jgi:hypothetical protein
MHMRAGFDHPHNAAVPASRPRRWRARQRGGMLCSRAGGLASHNRGPFQRDDGDEGAGMPIPQIVRQWNKAGLNRVTRHIAPGCPASVSSSTVPALRARISDAGQRVPRPGRICLRADLRPGHRLGQERPGRGRARAADTRTRHPAGLTAPVPRRGPAGHPSPGTAGIANDRRRRLPVP